MIQQADATTPSFRKSENLFAIRTFFIEIPQALPILFNESFKNLISTIFGNNFFIIKSIYFDKPGKSNWFVSYHQDLSISVTNKNKISGFGPWTVKQGYYGVQPPVSILENIYTVRIHLDDTDINNGALKILPKSHLKGVKRLENKINIDNEVVCEVSKGGIMLMKPLLMHSSSKTTNDKNRRVIHIEFSADSLPKPLEWAEKIPLPCPI
ncbi:phytanoyl-CoA dioxygenase family protein [Flavobacterium rhizosphaerae]|uniref:Phytanoyl-CoA dioxygenase family protein n=1 Tax=Flavobacterium rhizosphaerae TaxID=3163298 RepID=A0ABW8YY05_9FLAO